MNENSNEVKFSFMKIRVGVNRHSHDTKITITKRIGGVHGLAFHSHGVSFLEEKIGGDANGNSHKVWFLGVKTQVYLKRHSHEPNNSSMKT